MTAHDKTLSAQLARVTTGASAPTRLHEAFEREAARRPLHAAIEHCDTTLCYASLDAHANQIAAWLQDMGVTNGDLVGLYLNKSPRLYAAMLAILKVGAGYVPIDPRFPLDRITAIHEDADLKTIVTEGTLADKIGCTQELPIARLDDEADVIATMATLPIQPARAISPSDICYVIYTSGSTGRPKGVMIEHRNAVAFIETLDSVYKLNQDERVYQGFSIAFDASVEEIWAAFSLGGTLIVPHDHIEKSPADVAEFINDKAITYYSTVPTMLSMIESDLPSVTTLILGGEACSNELVTRWAIPGRRMLNTYGPTETTVVATWSECRPGYEVSIGKALPGYTAYVLNEDMQPVSAGEEGELFIGGEGVGRGYRNREQLTEERFLTDPFSSEPGGKLYRTNDHVRLGEDGDLYFIGRLDGQVKIRGFRVELSEIEAVLLEHPEIQAAAVAVVDGEEFKELAAYILCPNGESALNRDELLATLSARVPPYMIPRHLDVIDELPMMPSGKVDRKSLPRPITPLRGEGEIVPASTPLEANIAEIWAKTCSLSEVSVTADFFMDLGGHSLVAARVVSKLRATYPRVAVSLKDIYENRTVRKLAETLAKRGVDVQDASLTNSDPIETEPVEPNVGPVTRWTTATLQAVIALVYYGLAAAPLTFLCLLIKRVIEGNLDIYQAAGIATVASLVAWPSFVLLGIAIKWAVLGRARPGRYPVWSFYYLRWWTATRFQSLGWPNVFTGTPLMPLYWRAMGARVGRNVFLRTNICMAFDVISVGDNTSIGVETHILGCRVEDGHLVIAPVQIGNDCFIGMQSNLGLNTKMEDGAKLDDMSSLPDNTAMTRNEGRRGTPARPAYVSVPDQLTQPMTGSKRLAFGLAHLMLIYAMGYFIIVTIIPLLACLLLGYMYFGLVGAATGALLAVPISVLTYLGAAITLKKLLGPTSSTIFHIYSGTYLKHWFTSYLLENTRTILMAVCATLYAAPLLRALGADVGRGTEVSTASHLNPDHLTIGAGSFLADGCLVGGERSYNGTVSVREISIGNRTFIGNSALVAGGIHIADDVLIGVSSTPPSGTPIVPSNTRWLGSPGFMLPRTQDNGDFSSTETFAPSQYVIFQRAVSDLVRILLPGLLWTLSAIAFVAGVATADLFLPLWAAVLMSPIVAGAVATAAIYVTAAIKWTLIGKVEPLTKPL